MTDTNDAERHATMMVTAREMGLIDLDLLHLTRKNVPPHVAVKELQLRYPAAFRVPEPEFDARTATGAEVQAKWREILRKPGEDRQREFIGMVQSLGDARSMSREEFAAACAKIDRMK